MTLEFRNYVTLIIIALLIGGSGVAMLADSWIPRIDTYIKDVNGSESWTYQENIRLEDSDLFKIWIGAILGYGGIVVGTLYKASKGNGEE